MNRKVFIVFPIDVCCCVFFCYYVCSLSLECLEVGDPLTAEELEEKERLLEEASKIYDVDVL